MGDHAITVRELEEPEEFQEAVEVQREAWRMDDYREAAPAHLLRALADNGGLVLGAFAGSRMLGVSYGWPSGYYFYSHATGVRESSKYRGVGRLIKLEQRRRVIEKYGLSLAKWTFDPLQSLNSRFNLSRLGVIAREYYVDYYGEIRDNVNRGLGSDRVKVEWWLTSIRVEQRARRKCPVRRGVIEALGAVEAYDVVGGDPLRPGRRAREEDLLSQDVVLVPLPRDISSIRDRDPGVAREWRLATRWAYTLLLGSGYILVDNIDGGPGYTYNVLWRASLNKVLAGWEPWRECVDGEG